MLGTGRRPGASAGPLMGRRFTASKSDLIGRVSSVSDPYGWGAAAGDGSGLVTSTSEKVFSMRDGTMFKTWRVSSSLAFSPMSQPASTEAESLSTGTFQSTGGITARIEGGGGGRERLRGSSTESSGRATGAGADGP